MLGQDFNLHLVELVQLPVAHAHLDWKKISNLPAHANVGMRQGGTGMMCIVTLQ